MRRVNVRFSSLLNRWFYGVFGILFISGAVWVIVHYLKGPLDNFDETRGLWETWLLKIHGGAAMLSLLLLGSLIPSHMLQAWEQRRNRATALVLATLCVSLIGSGYGLYYFGSEEVRPFVSGFHSVAGFLFPLVLVWHILVGRRQRKMQRVKMAFSYPAPQRLIPESQHNREPFLT